MRQGRIIAVVRVLLAIAAGLLFGLPTASAQTPTPGRGGPSEAALTMSSPEDGTGVTTCEPGPPPEFRRTCTKTRQVDMYRPPRSNWSPLRAVLALLGWIVIPLCLAVFIADRRDESVVIAVALTLVLGWIGLALVYAFLGRSRRDEVAARLNV